MSSEGTLHVSILDVGISPPAKQRGNLNLESARAGEEMGCKGCSQCVLLALSSSANN